LLSLVVADKNGVTCIVKKIFRDLMLFQFINVLLQTLIAKSHDLLREEIVSVIYNMVSVDFAAFHKSFLPSFVDSVDSLSVQQKTLLLSNFSTAHVSLHYQGGTLHNIHAYE
jgi:hypothetical protein